MLYAIGALHYTHQFYLQVAWAGLLFQMLANAVLASLAVHGPALSAPLILIRILYLISTRITACTINASTVLKENSIHSAVNQISHHANNLIQLVLWVQQNVDTM